MHPEFEAVIGLEVHCQLSTQTKIFCSCPTGTGKSVGELEMNTHVCPTCAGHPGTLPVLNKKVVEYAIKAGLATGCTINLKNIFARKNYFYPDLPKGYQISQYEQPICENGFLEIETPSGTQKKVNIQRIHMEEDAGKSLHMSGFSLVNLNRAGVPLIEIVTGPDMRYAEEAGAYLRALHSIVTCLGISDGNMEEGNFRCDANVSVRPVGSERLGTRTEIKNVNSFRFVEKAIQYEIARHIEVINSGGKIIQETRTFDSARGVTLSMRSKEEAQDYRYFPDPDLIPVHLDAEWVESLRKSLPELPEQSKTRLMKDWGLSAYDAGLLSGSKSLLEYYESVIRQIAGGDKKDAQNRAKSAAKPAANWVTGEVLRLLNETGTEISKSKLTPSHLAAILNGVLDQTLSSTGAKQVLAAVWDSGERVEEVVERLGLKQVNDDSALEPTIDKVIAAFPSQVAEYRAGKDKLLGFFVGQVMKESGGKANPGRVGDLIKKKLS